MAEEASAVAGGSVRIKPKTSGAALVAVAVAATLDRRGPTNDALLPSTYEEQRSPSPARPETSDVCLYLFRLTVSTPTRSQSTTVDVDLCVGRDPKDCVLCLPDFSQLSRRHCTIHLRYTIEGVRLESGQKRPRIAGGAPLWGWAVSSATAGVVDHGSLNGTSVLVEVGGEPELKYVDPQCPVAVPLPPVTLASGEPLHGLFAVLAPQSPVNLAVYHLTVDHLPKAAPTAEEVPRNVAMSYAIKRRVATNLSRSPHIPISLQSTGGPTSDDLFSGSSPVPSVLRNDDLRGSLEHLIGDRAGGSLPQFSASAPLTVLALNVPLLEREVAALKDMGVIVVTPALAKRFAQEPATADVLLSCDPEQALYRQIGFIVVAPPFDLSVRLLAAIPHAHGVLSHHWLQDLLGKRNTGGIANPRDYIVDEGQFLALEAQHHFSMRHLLHDFGPTERRQLFIPLKFYIHPSCVPPSRQRAKVADTPIVEEGGVVRVADAPLYHLRSIIVSSGGVVVEDPVEGDANVLVFPSIPRSLPLFGWGQHHDEEETDDAEEESEVDEEDECAQQRRRKRPEKDPSAAAKAARIKRLQRERELLGLPCPGTIPTTLRATLLASIRQVANSSRNSPLRRRRGANAFRLWCLNRHLVSEGKSIPKPASPARGISLRNAANQEFVAYARAASGLLTPAAVDHSGISIVNPDNLGKDDVARCNVLGVCVPGDIIQAVLRQQRQLSLRLIGDANN